MINASEIIKTWPGSGMWSIAPAGIEWAAEGDYVRLGDHVHLGNDVHLGDHVSLGNGVRLGNGVTDAIDLGHFEEYRKVLALKDGIAYIGAGCRWFTLQAALDHWRDREDRPITWITMESAIRIAKLKGWALE